MPNWCYNRLNINGPAEEITRFRQMAAGEIPGYDKEIEVPKGHEIYMADWDNRSDVFECFRLDPLVFNPDNVSPMWAGDEWETKWGFRETELVDEGENHLYYQFESAWAPPIGFIERILEKFPSLHFQLEYFEPGMGFAGEFNASHQEGSFNDPRDATREDSIEWSGYDPYIVDIESDLVLPDGLEIEDLSEKYNQHTDIIEDLFELVNNNNIKCFVLDEDISVIVELVCLFDAIRLLNPKLGKKWEIGFTQSIGCMEVFVNTHKDSI